MPWEQSLGNLGGRFPEWPKIKVSGIEFGLGVEDMLQNNMIHSIYIYIYVYIYMYIYIYMKYTIIHYTYQYMVAQQKTDHDLLTVVCFEL